MPAKVPTKGVFLVSHILFRSQPINLDSGHFPDDYSSNIYLHNFIPNIDASDFKVAPFIPRLLFSPPTESFFHISYSFNGIKL